VAYLVLLAFVAQAAAMLFDEGVFHRRRRLPRWERVGHPLDTGTVLLCYAWLLAARPSDAHLVVYVGLVMASSLFITKDERLHATHCTAAEHWLHAVLFVLHPIVLFGAAWLWWSRRFELVLVAQVALTSAFALYQLLYWNWTSWRTRPWPHIP
jgi:hypothetical protein